MTQLSDFVIRKRHLAALEKLYAAEIDAALARKPYLRLVQSKAKVFTELLENGYAQFEEQRTYLRNGGGVTMTISGWVLTELGRLTYCVSCGDEPTDG